MYACLFGLLRTAAFLCSVAGAVGVVVTIVRATTFVCPDGTASGVPTERPACFDVNGTSIAAVAVSPVPTTCVGIIIGVVGMWYGFHTLMIIQSKQQKARDVMHERFMSLHTQRMLGLQGNILELARVTDAPVSFRPSWENRAAAAAANDGNGAGADEQSSIA